MAERRSHRVQMQTRMSSSYIAARTRERAELRFLDEKIDRLKTILEIEREISQLRSKTAETPKAGLNV